MDEKSEVSDLLDQTACHGVKRVFHPLIDEFLLSELFFNAFICIGFAYLFFRTIACCGFFIALVVCFELGIQFKLSHGFMIIGLKMQ